MTDRTYDEFWCDDCKWKFRPDNDDNCVHYTRRRRRRNCKWFKKKDDVEGA